MNFNQDSATIKNNLMVKGFSMKKFGLIVLALAAWVSVSNAQACPEANYNACSGDGYAIVETEANTYWPHNQMEAAHWLGNRVHRVRHHRSHRRVRHHRRHRHHAVRRHHRRHCRCTCR